MKYLIGLILFVGSSSAQAAKWGSVDLRLPKSGAMHIELVAGPTDASSGTLNVRSRSRGNFRVTLTAAQFRQATSWLRYHYVHEQELRNKRKEKAACATGVGTLKIEPGILQMQLCREVARHHVLALKTADFFEKYLNTRAVASADN